MDGRRVVACARGALLLFAVGLLLAGCDSTGSLSARAGNVSGSTTVSESQGGDRPPAVEIAAVRNRPPVIRRLSGTFPPQRCFLTSADGRLVRGTPRGLVFGYSDPDGNVRGGKVRIVATFAPQRVSTTVVLDVPSQFAVMSGTTSGGVSLIYCLGFGPVATGFTEAVTLLDRAQRPSNVLTINTTRPAGAPELRLPGPDPGSGETAEGERG